MGSSCAKDLNYLIAFKEEFLKGLGVEGCSSWTVFSLGGSKEIGQCFRNLNPLPFSSNKSGIYGLVVRV